MAKQKTDAYIPLEHSATLWLLAVALATAGPHANHLPLWLSMLVGALLLWRTWLWFKQAPLPHRILLALLVAASVAGIGWEFRTLFGRDAGVALLVLFMALKPMETRSRRDALVVVMLGYFLLLTHYFYTQNISTGFWLLAATTLLTATLIRLYGGAQPATAIARYAGSLLLQALPFMVILYLLFPRISGPLWGLPQDAHSGLSGLSEKMAPGSLSNLIQSSAIAFRVNFSGAPPEKAKLYWRGPTFDEYDGLTWRAHELSTNTLSAKPVIEAIGEKHQYTSTIEAHNQRWLLALDVPIDQPDGSKLAPTLEVLAKDPVQSRTRFTFTSAIAFRANIFETSAVLQHALELPAGINPRTRQLAIEWKNKFSSPEEIREAALNLFRTQNFFYTLRPPLLGQHAMDQFLFTSRRGFCEHYASAFVFLMRSAGVPARVVTGYQGGETNPVDGFLTVRQSDAHAWAEIWLAGEGWVRVDPTAAVAPSRIELGITAALPSGETLPMLSRTDIDWLRDLRNRWEALNNGWNQWVLGYNPERQRELMSRLGIKDADWHSMTAALAVLCGTTLLLISMWTLCQRNSTDPAKRAWQRYCSGIKRCGIIRNDWEGPYDFAARIANEREDLAALSNEAALLYADLRYGNGSKEQLRRLNECARRLPTRWRKKA